MKDAAVLVLDCGATNIRVVAMDAAGRTIAQAGEPNEPVPQPAAVMLARFEQDLLAWVQHNLLPR